MRKLFCLVPDESAMRRIVSELQGSGIDIDHIGIVADHRIRFDARLHAEELEQNRYSDFLPALEKGAVAGGMTGLCAGLVAVAFPPAGLALGGTALLGITGMGAGFGVWMASMVGISLPHQDIEAFAESIENGALLLLVDIESERQDAVAASIRRHHPEAEIRYSSIWVSGMA